MMSFLTYIMGWRFGPSMKMAPTAELSLTLDPMGNSHKNPQKPLGQLQSNFCGMILGWPPSKIVSGDPDFQPRWPPS